MKKDLTRTLLAIIFIGLLGGASFWVLKPFLPALAWATMLVVATWPLLRWVQARLGNRRGLAVMVMVSVLLLVLFVPILFAVGSVLQYSDVIVSFPKQLSTMALPPPPNWLMSIPLVGSWLANKWMVLSSAGEGAISQYLTPHSSQFVRWLLSQMGNFGLLMVNFLLAVVISVILYFTGETAANGVLRFARRLAGARGENTALLATQAIRAVALGIIVTAVVQAIVGGIGLAIAGVPYLGTLIGLMIALGIAQLGSAPVVLLCSIWFFWQGQSSWGIFLLVWTVIVSQIDNFLRPYLIKRGVDLPLLLIFAGVIGGLISMGVIGLFVGPLVLAVTYTLLIAWVKDGE